MAIDFGLKPEWSELNAWNELTQAHLNKFESKAIHMISLVYSNKISEYDGKETPRPYVGNVKESSQAIQNILRNR